MTNRELWNLTVATYQRKLAEPKPHRRVVEAATRLVHEIADSLGIPNAETVTTNARRDAYFDFMRESVRRDLLAGFINPRYHAAPEFAPVPADLAGYAVVADSP